MKEVIYISTLKELPDYCYDCPCCNCETGCCQADEERRTSNWRHFWCPLEKDAIPSEFEI